MLPIDNARAVILRSMSKEFGTDELAFELGKFLGIASSRYTDASEGMWTAASIMYSGPNDARLWSQFVAGWNYAHDTYLHHNPAN